MALVSEQKKSQNKQDVMRMYYRRDPEVLDRDTVNIPTPGDPGTHCDSPPAFEDKDVDENETSTVKHLRFGIENILQQDSKKQKKPPTEFGLHALSECFSQPFSAISLLRGNVGTCYPFSQEVVFPWRDTGEEKSSNCQSKKH